MAPSDSLEAFAAGVPGDRPRLLFALHNRSDRPRRIPIFIGPLGYLVKLRIAAAHGTVWASSPVKVRLKLDPALATSYRDLEPGSIHGEVFDLRELELAPGLYTAEVQYFNGPFQGTVDHPIGEIRLDAATELRID